MGTGMNDEDARTDKSSLLLYEKTVRTFRIREEKEQGKGRSPWKGLTCWLEKGGRKKYW